MCLPFLPHNPLISCNLRMWSALLLLPTEVLKQRKILEVKMQAVVKAGPGDIVPYVDAKGESWQA